MTDADHLGTTRAFYDAIAVDYTEHFRNDLESKPLDRAMLGAFAEIVRTDGGGPVADLGCGPGRAAAHLHGLGLDVFGLDLSSAMVDVAREEHPALRFEQGSMTELGLADGSLAGIVAWYSIIHTPAELLPSLFTEFHRVLAPGGHLLLAFQVGDEPLHLAQPFGHPVALDFRRLSPDHIAGLLTEAGFTVTARMVRDATASDSAPQAFLVAHRSIRPASD